MNDNPIRRAVDTRLSGLAFTPQMQADTLRRARLCNQTPHMRRKLSYSLAFALLALLLAATAGAAAYFPFPRRAGKQRCLSAAYSAHRRTPDRVQHGDHCQRRGIRRLFPLFFAGYRPPSGRAGGLSLSARNGDAGGADHPNRRHGFPAGFGG